MSTYAGVYLTYAIPAIGVLAFVARPFIDRKEILKFTITSSMGCAYAWLVGPDCFIPYRGAAVSTLDKNATAADLASNGVYLFFVVQLVTTALWTLLCGRWSFPCLMFNNDKRSYELIRWIPISVLSVTAAVGYGTAVPARDAYCDLGRASCAVSSTVIFIWYGAGNFFVKKFIPSSVAIIVSTLHVCWVDRIARENDTRLAGQTTGSDPSVAEHFISMQAAFFLTTNCLIVLAMTAYDKALGMTETYTLEFPQRFGFNWTFVCQLIGAFFTSEYSMPSIVVEDLKEIFRVVHRSSRTFYISKLFFPTGK